MKGWRSCCSGGDGLDGLAVCKLDFYEKAPLEEIKRRIFSEPSKETAAFLGGSDYFLQKLPGCLVRRANLFYNMYMFH